MRKSHERSGLLFWCRNCNIPLIAEKCGICGMSGSKILLHHGMEIRPGFDYTLRRINRILEENYGVSDALGHKLVLLHKIAGIDRAEEIIVDGEIFGTIAYIPEQRKFTVTLRSYGAHLLRQEGANKNLAVVDERALKRHLKNGWLYPHEILSLHDVSGTADTILAIGKFTGVGVPKFKDAGNLPEKCMRVRDIGKWENHRKKSTVETMVRGNEGALKALEQKAVAEIKGVIARFPGHEIGVSFSGGKDSAVAMHLLGICLENFFVLFVDTGLEFPETVEYVEKIAGGRKLYILKPETPFWSLVEEMGPPAKDYRWCCKVCKLAPVAKFAAEHHQKIVCIEGRRKAESFAREHIELVEQNPFVPGQILVNPIRDWSAFHVWLYILWRKIDVNPLYHQDFERIGCYLCPAEHACEFEEVANLHRERYDKWIEFLKKWGRSQGLPDSFWENGVWRWRTPPKKIGADGGERVEMKVRETVTCNGEAILDGRFPFPPETQEIAENSLGILGETLRRHEAIIVKTGRARILFFPNADFSVVSDERASAEKALLLMVQQLLRARFCTSCRICVRACTAKAIRIKGGKPEYNLKACRRCLKCIGSCVVARYYDKRVGIEVTSSRLP
ncbi:MAG: phosphoadenosine phosphosulfate reductase family protein [Thermoplasmata archaeon]|nr:phosphoadenosine phosphosulfate reductase family protein [Thermoplasmata archaeon]